MMRTLIIIISIILFALCGSAQNLKADFVQTRYLKMLNDKTMSKGRLEVSGQTIKWEYVSPFACTIIINKDKVTVKREGKQQMSYLAENREARRLFRMFGSSIMINGKKGTMKDISVPKDMKQIYSRITVQYNNKTGTADKVTLYEQEGDRTEIVLTRRE